MGGENLNILYFCADRGISINGTKGASVHIREFARAFTAAGHRVSVVTRNDGNPAISDLQFESIILPQNSIGVNLECGNAFNGDKHALGDFAEYYQNPYLEMFLAELAAERSFDAIYERYSLFSKAGLKFAVSAGLPFILEVNAPLVLETSQYRNLGLPQLARALERHLFTEADSVIAISNQLRDYILNVAPGARVVVVPNGVDFARFDVAREKYGTIGHSLKAALHGKFTIGFVGNIRPWHGIELLLEAFANLATRDDDIRLLVIGDTGKLQGRIDRLCSDLRIVNKITFTGSVPLEDVPSLLELVDIAVAPYPDLSDFYFSSLKIFEYMAAEKAIVASRIGQIAEILEDGKNALLIPPGDTRALSDAIYRLRKDPLLRRDLASRARIEAQQKHSWIKRIETISQIIYGFKMAGQRKYHENKI